MTPEERQLLEGLFDRTQAASGNMRDPEAERFIQEAVRQQPYAPYLLAQAVIVQEQALRAANERLQDLEARIRELESEGRNPGQGGFLGGLGKSIFGSGPSSEPPRSSVPPSGRSPWTRRDAYEPPQPGPGAWQQAGAQAPGGGGSFLRGALGAAAGVAGGVLLANSLSGLFSGQNNPLGIGSGVQNASQGGDSGQAGSGFDPLPPGRIGDEPAPQATPAAYDDPGYDDGGSDWGGGDDTSDI